MNAGSISEFPDRASINTWQEVRDIVRFPVDNDPARVLGIVFGDISAGKLRLRHDDRRDKSH